MERNMCPLLQSECVESKCEWYLGGKEVCAVVILAKEMVDVTSRMEEVTSTINRDTALKVRQYV